MAPRNTNTCFGAFKCRLCTLNQGICVPTRTRGFVCPPWETDFPLALFPWYQHAVIPRLLGCSLKCFLKRKKNYCTLALTPMKNIVMIMTQFMFMFMETIKWNVQSSNLCIISGMFFGSDTLRYLSCRLRAKSIITSILRVILYYLYFKGTLILNGIELVVLLIGLTDYCDWLRLPTFGSIKTDVRQSSKFLVTEVRWIFSTDCLCILPIFFKSIFAS